MGSVVESTDSRNAVHRPAREPSLAALRETAVLAALSAGRVAARSHTRRPVVLSQQEHDLKLDVIQAAEEALLEVIACTFPEDDVLSEGAGGLRASGNAASSRLWVVDPLDGTGNYFYGIPWFCSSVACFARVPADGDRLAPWHRAAGLLPLAAAVYQPASEELFVAACGCGATLNGTTLQLAPAKLEASLVSVTISAWDGREASEAALAARLAGRARKVRSFGATALDTAYVAAGRFGAHVQTGAHLWDLAAAAIILEESGGIVEARETRPGRWQLLASNPGLYAELAAVSGQP